jgi:hypothetical protein
MEAAMPLLVLQDQCMDKISDLKRQIKSIELGLI